MRSYDTPVTYPKEDMIYLRLIQKMDGAGNFGDEFLTAVYQGGRMDTKSAR